MTTVITSLQYSNSTNTFIDMNVAIDGGTAFPFTYNPTDTSSTAASVKALLAGGGYTIAAYVPTTIDVDVFRDARLSTGFADTTTGKTFQCDVDSQGKWTAIGASSLAAIVTQTSPAPTYELITSDNSTITLSATDALALTNGRIMPWVSATMLYASSLKTQITGAHPPADITQGWP